jgi:uncharacterized protein involved in exopolysaccharide biosynthesis
MGTERGFQPRLKNEDQFLQTQYGLLKSRSLAERVAKALNLGDDPGFVPAGRPPAGRDLAATLKLVHGLEVLPVRGSHLVNLFYRDGNPDRATRIVNAFASNFIAAAAERRYDATAYARSLLQSRLSATREKLEASERQLVGYAKDQGILQLDHGSGAVGPQASARDDGPTGGSGDSLSAQSLTTLNGALTAAISDRITAEQRYRQAVANPTSGDALQNPTVQSLRTEREKLEADYRERLSTFQPDFPEMQATRTHIAQIDTALARETGDVSSALRSGYLAALGREADLRMQVDQLRASVLDLRNRGIGYTILQREVDTNRILYDALLQRFKEIGVVGGLGESDAEVVDTALPPRGPFEPRPMRNLLVGLLAGLVVGLGLAFAIEFIDDTIKAPEDAASKLKLPVLGVVPRMAKTGAEAAAPLECAASDRGALHREAGGLPIAKIIDESVCAGRRRRSGVRIARSNMPRCRGHRAGLRKGRHHRSQLGEMIGAPQIVGVDQRHPIASRRCEAPVARSSRTGILLPDQEDPRIARRFHQRRATICRAIVDDDHLQRRPALREHAGKRAFDERRLVVKRDHHREEGLHAAHIRAPTR